MARLARLVVPGLPHHVTQRGNGGAQTFFGDGDYALYRDLLAQACRDAGVAVWCWVLMPNHVHLVLVPSDEDGLRRALAAVHRRYAGHIHARERRTGHFWQGRYGAVVLDEAHLLTAVRYVLLNPVRARLAARAADWPWSSVHALLAGRDDGLTTVAPVLARCPGFGELLDEAAEQPGFRALRRAEGIGRPLGDDAFVAALERLTRRMLRPGKPGPKPAIGRTTTALSP
jgi:putative transposase